MSEPRDQPREVLGPFLVYERVGTGGSSTVWRARKSTPEGGEAEVCLKLLHSHLATDPRAVAEFVQEAKLASLMDHQNICRFMEVGRLGDRYFIAMEYIEGKHLGEILKEASREGQPPPVAVTLSLLCQLCDALEYAHEAVDDNGAPLKLVHRDISPSNLMVTRDGALKLIDLGIAKTRTSRVRTETGVIKGKLGYLAPELLRGARADRRADIFAIGIVGWELLTARRLFGGHTDAEVLARIAGGVIELPSSVNPACPPHVETIIMRALARDKVGRWPSAGAMGRALRAAASVLHEPIDRRVVAAWLKSAPSAPVVDPEHSDAITLVRNKPPPALPDPPARFATGTGQLPLAPPPPRLATEAEPLALPPPPRAHRWLSLIAGASIVVNMILLAFMLARGPSATVALELPVPPELPPERLPSLPVPVVVEPGTPATAEAAPKEAAAGVPAPTSDAEPPTPAAAAEPPARRPDGAEPTAPGRVREAEPAGGSREHGPRRIDAAAVERVYGKAPRSRASRDPYRATVCIGEDGRVTEVTVREGPARLHSRIARTLRRWRYRPYERAGSPTRVCFDVDGRLDDWRR